MSKQYKKLQKKLYQKPKENKPKQKPIGHDYLLTGIFIFTVVITIVGWNDLTWLNRAMYLLLAVSFGLTLLQRHGKFSDEMRTKISIASTIAVVVAIVMFLIVLFFQFTS